MVSGMAAYSIFPLDASELLPHSGSMRCIDRLLTSTKTAAVADVDLKPKHSLLSWGKLDPAGYIELAAQTAGAMQGYDQRTQGLEPKFGMLVGTQNFTILDYAYEGERLLIDVTIIAELGELTVMDAVIRRGETVLAHGQIKVYVPD